MSSLLNLTTNNLWDEFGSKLCKGAAGGFTGNDLGHLLSDSSDLGGGSICGLLDLVRTALGECNGE